MTKRFVKLGPLKGQSKSQAFIQTCHAVIFTFEEKANQRWDGELLEQNKDEKRLGKLF